MQNFWEISGWEEEDRHLQSLKKASFRRPFPDLPKGPGLFVIRGPRQIGKSCWLKTLLRNDTPEQSYYLSCENVSDYKELAEILKSLSEKKTIYLDEVTFADQWWRAVKHHLDKYAKARIIITGSHSNDIKKGMDQMPGRWGNGGEFELLPMDFFEFSKMRQQAGWGKLNRIEELELYFKIGGFPIALEETNGKNIVPTKAMETYRRWLLGDLTKLGKQEAYLKEIVSQIAITSSSTISLQKLAQKTQIGSHNTALDYIELLEICFALGTLYALDPNSGSPKFRKEKKFYFRDPLIYWLSIEWASIKAPENSADVIAEMVAYEHLRRRYKRFGYYSDRKGEIDFYAHKQWAIEVKWKSIPEGLSKSYKNLLCPKKIVWTKGNFLAEWP